jgi:SP family sugar:H+ symporter-like MFS transporter
MNSYIVSFLMSTGVTNVFPVIMGLYTLYYVAILTGHFLPDTVGRRPILIGTATFCGVSLAIVSALVVAFKSPSDVQGKVSIALIFLWEISFGVQSPLIWITTAEAAPSRNREKVQSIATFFGFGVSLLITSVSPYIQDKGYGNLGGRIVSKRILSANYSHANIFLGIHLGRFLLRYRGLGLLRCSRDEGLYYRTARLLVR